MFKIRAAELAQRGEGSLWIVKPGSLNRGNGIVVVPSAKAALAVLKGKRPGGQWVIQKYLENPLLLDGRKFDIRLFVLVTPSLQVFIQGLTPSSTPCTHSHCTLLTRAHTPCTHPPCIPCTLLTGACTVCARRCRSSCTRTATCARALLRTTRTT